MNYVVITEFDRRHMELSASMVLRPRFDLFEKEKRDEIDRQDAVNSVPYYNSEPHLAAVRDNNKTTEADRKREKQEQLNKTARSERQWSFHNQPYIDLG